MRGALLAGGTSSRYGGKPKGLERVGGERIADRIIRGMREALQSEPIIVANDPAATDWFSGFEIVHDIIPGCGSLGGLYTAVAHQDSPVLVVAWDMPFVRPELLTALCAGAEPYDVFVPTGPEGEGVEPMCGVYAPGCREPMRISLEDEDYRATGFHAVVNVGTLTPDTLARFGEHERIFFNVNTPDDLQKANELWRKHG